MAIQLTRLARTENHEELLDVGAGTSQDVQESLDDLWRINRFLGGVYSLTRHLYPYLRHERGELTLIDLGTGSAQLAQHIAHWAQRHGCKLQIYGVDLSTRHLNIASKRLNGDEGIQLVQADALQLPIPENSVDYLISSLFLHHLNPDQVVDLLAQSFKCIRKALVISDLERGWLPLAAFKLVQPIFARSYLTRHDGALSIRRAYTPSELKGMAVEAGLQNIRVHQQFPWRMTLVAEK